MTRRISNYELSLGRGKISVGHIDCNSLLAFSAETIGKIGQIHLSTTGNVGRSFQRIHLVLHDRLGIIQQTANERGLAIVYRAASVEAQQISWMWGLIHTN